MTIAESMFHSLEVWLQKPAWIVAWLSHCEQTEAWLRIAKALSRLDIPLMPQHIKRDNSDEKIDKMEDLKQAHH